jgi:glycogen debranching enzyme
VGDWVVTPRQGKPVEIQALWYNALRIMQEFGGQEFGGQEYRELADRARESFRAQFWNPRADCLYDVIDGDARDASIRPNQLFAISLTHRMLDDDAARRILAVVERELLTPAGLRTLSPKDPKYRGRYEGGVASRDSAYHQGTVWPWLLAPFLTAYARLKGGDLPSQLIAGMETLLTSACLGQLFEVADGDAPHQPGGCPAQAWSIGALLGASVGQASRPVPSPVNEVHAPTARHSGKRAAKKRIAGHA